MTLRVEFEHEEPPRLSLKGAGLLAEMLEQAHADLMAERAAEGEPDGDG